MFKHAFRRTSGLAITWAGMVGVIASCGSDSPPPTAPSSPDGNTLSFVSSSPQDFVGQGQSMAFTSPSNIFVGQMTEGNRRLQIAVSVGTAFVWNLRLAAPPGQQLVPGSYANATFSSVSPTAQMEFSGQNRSCGQNGVGEFEVLRATYGPGQPATSADPPISGTIVRFVAHFTQRCSAASPPLTGDISVTNLPRIGAVVLR